MKTLVMGIAFAAAVASAPALAQGRPDSLRLSCAQASGLVRASGAAVIGTGPNIYDRYVADRRYCGVAEGTVPAWIRTRDTPQCFTGYLCKPLRDTLPWFDD